MHFEILRDPVWNNIRVDDLTLELVDTEVFQRLRYVRQLGWTYLVYPGATHTRFEHALGTHHLSRRTLALLCEAEDATSISEEEQAIVRSAALLHDVGHYPFSHALEEIGALHHEDVARPLITQGAIASLLKSRLGDDAPARVFDLIRGESRSALQGLISGSLDLDKIEYLKRDAFMCGVPYGEIDVDRLTNSLVLVDDPATGCPAIGVQEKALSALESLLFAKYQMYRNVYWHHAVRSATAMYKRLVEDAVEAGVVDGRSLAAYTDEGLMHRLESAFPTELLVALKGRKLYKRAAEWPAAELDDDAVEWIASDRKRVSEAENVLAREFGLAPGELLLDYPAKTQMLGLDIPVLRRNGKVERLTGEGWIGTINLPSLSEELYKSARWLRVFTARRTKLEPRKILDALERLG
ncbi:MAG: metal-dependent phosphohydrolase sub protein [Gemmatimonadales bacterium]|nr:metal-dependent phosphohydrolase sub protein [Gemmatimonadales bacterium]